MAQGELGIINDALAKIGKQFITSRTQSNAEARTADQLFNNTRDIVLRSHAWSSCVRRATLVKLAATDSRLVGLHDYDYGYGLPSDYIRMSPQTNIWGAYRIEGRLLLTSESEDINIVYVSNDANYYATDPLVTDAIATLLASKMVMPLRGELNMRRLLLQEYEVIMDEARYNSDVDGGTGDGLAFNRSVEGGFGNPRQAWIRNDAEGLSSGS